MDSRIQMLLLVFLTQWTGQQCSAAELAFQPFEAMSVAPLPLPPLDIFSDEVKESTAAEKKVTSYEVVEAPDDLSRLPAGVVTGSPLHTAVVAPERPIGPEEEKAVSASNFISFLAQRPPEPERKMFTDITRSVPVLNYLQGIERIREEPKEEGIDKETLEAVFGEPPKPVVPEPPKPIVPEPPKPVVPEPPRFGPEKLFGRGSRWAMYFGSVFVRGLSDLLGGARSALDEYIRPPKE